LYSKINESARLAQQVHNSITSQLSQPPTILKDMGVKQAPFYVLIGAGMPSILVELAFISNPDDARLLANDSFIDDMAGSIASGITQYVNANTAQL
jgi:N-acetylmuramoyl-L-alanine amidase